METIKKLGKALNNIYVGIGTAAMGLLALCVIFTVIARYFFSLSWKELEEFVTTLFAFTTFWGLGVAVLESEHVVIDILFRLFKPQVQRIINIFNLLIALGVCLTVSVFSFTYIGKIGGHLSPGMMIPMKYLYGIMPICFIICAICILIKIILLVGGNKETGSFGATDPDGQAQAAGHAG